jgi:hypothetical protein
MLVDVTRIEPVTLPLLVKHRTRYHPLYPIFPATSISNKSGNLSTA